VKIASSML